MAHVDILRPLTEAEVEELLKLYKTKYGRKNFQYLLIYNHCKWNKQLCMLNNVVGSADNNQWIPFKKIFYTRQDTDFRKYGTYVSLCSDNKQMISFNSWEPELTELWQCIIETKYIDWKSGPLLTNVDPIFCERVKEIAITKGTSVQRARICIGLILPHEEALYLKVSRLPSGYYMDRLKVECAELVHSVWANNKENSLQFVRGIIQLNNTLGIYRESDNELMAWIVQNDFSGLGMLQVLPAVQRLGLGTILAAELSKRIAITEEVDLSAWIVKDNNKSRGLLQKVGYREAIINEWIQFNNVNEVI